MQIYQTREIFPYYTAFLYPNERLAQLFRHLKKHFSHLTDH
jgi:hypothetical protein